MFTQLQYAGDGWFTRKTFQGVNCVEKINFRRGAGRARVLEYTNKDLDRVESPDHSMHMVSHYAHQCLAAMKDGHKQAEDFYTRLVLKYTDACLGQITRRF